MNISISAVHHFDPLCKQRLLKWLFFERSTHCHPPTFVAVEWDCQIFEQILKQRKIVYNLAKKRWPNATTKFLYALAEAVAYEGDTHMEVFPDIPTIWLDQGITIDDQTIITDYAKDRINVYVNLIGDKICNFDEETLHFMSRRAWERSEFSNNRKTDRDDKFSSIIINKYVLNPNKWAIVIVGANHAKKHQGTMISELENHGFNIEVSKLNPKWD
ncbi:MAG TPA: hypothetical protein G4N92_07640 [Anaerolineae bacterium]|nr:hypothetical protein [Anaerolineae bacterium]